MRRSLSSRSAARAAHFELTPLLQNRILAKQIEKELQAQAELTGTMTMAGAMGSQLASIESDPGSEGQSGMEMRQLADKPPEKHKKNIPNVDVRRV